MDAASDLVEVFLRVNGYLTLSEWQVQAQDPRGQWVTVTDVDVLGIRFPGEIYLAYSPDPEVRSHLSVRSDLLMLEEDVIDVIVGEVKEGEAEFNPAMVRPETLYSVLHRLAWLYPEGKLATVISDLGSRGICRSSAPEGATVRTRLVAFGQASHTSVNTVPLDHLLEEMGELLIEHEAELRSVMFANPVAATLKLLQKSGLDLNRGS